MDVVSWAKTILGSSKLEDKLYAPDVISDDTKREAIFWGEPTRSAQLRFQKHTKTKDKLPSFPELGDPEKRAICLHRFAGHELLAVEMMAYALLAFPNTPTFFKKGLITTLKEEQEHVRLYQKRLQELGLNFGDEPLYRHFWGYVPYIKDPATYLSVMSLTLEMANLDFAPIYGKRFLEHGDEQSSQLMRQIFKDEVGHVSFGYHWLKRFKDDSTLSDYQFWQNSLPLIMSPKQAKGRIFHEENRRMAGIPDDWIEELKKL